MLICEADMRRYHNPCYPSLFQVNTRVWLNQISQTIDRQATLDDIPQSELNRLSRLGFDWIYFMGVWQTGSLGQELSRSHPDWLNGYRQTLPDVSQDDICGSPFAVTGYQVHLSLGGDEAIKRLHQRLENIGIRLMLDFIPNHTALDHPWAREHPEFYLEGTETQLELEPNNYYQCQTTKGKVILARGRDPYFPGWLDTLQLNYANPELQGAMKKELQSIAGLCDGVRCDMAMLILPEIFQQTWKVQTAPFWPSAIQAVKDQFPDFRFMAEVYWGMEEILIKQGFDYAYDKSLYDKLLAKSPGQVYQHLKANLQTQANLARFLENHDEVRAAGAFPADIHQAAAIITYLSPGLRFFHQGQLEGFRKKIPVHLCRAPLETFDPVLSGFYRRLLELLSLPAIRDGDWQLLESIPPDLNDPTHQSILAFVWQGIEQTLLIVINYANNPSHGTLHLTGEFGKEPSIELKQLFFSEPKDLQAWQVRGLNVEFKLTAWGFAVLELLSDWMKEIRWKIQ